MVSRIGNDLNIPVLFEDSDQRRPLSNKESTWRDDRYEWFHSLSGPVVTAHTLDDAVEWYMMTCLRGRGEFMSYQNKNVIRPFILTRKSELQEHAVEMNLSWWDDTTNYDPSFSLRAKVRKILVPVAEDCEPGLHTMVRRRLIEKVKDD
jgi:tRNA(Ile)-lysidine synthase TilS/MesJ